MHARRGRVLPASMRLRQARVLNKIMFAGELNGAAFLQSRSHRVGDGNWEG